MNIKIFDGHNDTLTADALAGSGGAERFVNGCEGVHIDLPRSRQGGLAAGCFAIFIDTPEGQEVLGHYQAVDSVGRYVDFLTDIQAFSHGQVQLCRNISEIRSAMDSDKLAVLLHFEGAEPIAEDLANLEYWYGRGLRSLGICWSRQNCFGKGVCFGFGNSSDNGPGLTAAGKELIRQCNRLGIIVDGSHLNARGLADMLNISNSPVVISHGCCWELCHSPRNYTDDQIRAVADSGGLIGVNFYVGFLRSDGKKDTDTPISVILRHIEHIANLVGIDHVAFGSDFDGAQVPDTLADVAGLPKIIDLLVQAGYSESEIKKIASENWLRVVGDICK